MSPHEFRPHLSSAEAPDIYSDLNDRIDEAALADAMQVVPWGAGVLAGTAVALLVAGYLLIYVLVFVPRGVVG